MEHESCNKTNFNQPLPSRVLELVDPSDEMRGVRLIETEGDMRWAYACLSYCWGVDTTQTGKTTSENLPQRLLGIPFNELPKTIIDAIYLCHKLGFRYLWVDRLCIMQDSQTDWLEQASKMCEIYSRSALTISVPICERSLQSFLVERCNESWEQMEMQTFTHTAEESGFKSKSWFSNYRLSRAQGPWLLDESWGLFCSVNNNRRNQWLERGWTFQEWILSPRVLHIDSITLWDCFDGYANELSRRHMGEAVLLRNPKEFGAGISWDSVIKEYSRRHITKKEDRLPALAGLADRYAQATGHKYLAGLWYEDMPRSLLWYVNSEPVVRRQPSWSWASVDGSAIYQAEFCQSFIARVRMWSSFCEYDPPSSFTAVKTAWIDIEGCTSVVMGQTEYDHDRLKLKVGDKWWETYRLYEHRYPDNAIADGKVYLLPLGSNTCGSRKFYVALVLQECGWEDGRQCFQRLCIARLEVDPTDSRPPEVGSTWVRHVVRLL